MNIVIVAYRPNHDDIVRGCCVSRTDSEIEIIAEESILNAANRVAKLLAWNNMRDRFEYAAYEFTTIIDGLSEDHYDYNYEIQNKVFDEGMKIADAIVEEHEELKRKAEEEKRLAEEARQQERDLVQFEQLKKKLGK